MAEIVICQTDGYRNSIASALHIATQVKSLGKDVAVVFMEAATAALAERKFVDSPLLAKYSETIDENLKKLGYSVDTMDYLRMCKSMEIPLYASGGWCDFLGVREKLPPEVQVIEIPETMRLIAEAKKIIGGP